MVYGRNFTLQKYVFPANFTNVKSEFFSKKFAFRVIDFIWLSPLQSDAQQPNHHPSTQFFTKSSDKCFVISEKFATFVKIYNK
jgi:hypothetical protein